MSKTNEAIDAVLRNKFCLNTILQFHVMVQIQVGSTLKRDTLSNWVKGEVSRAIFAANFVFLAYVSEYVYQWYMYNANHVIV